MTPRYVDVRACLQAKVEEFGGGVLELVAAKVDANQLFGNPLPGKKKELRVRYLVVVSAACLSHIIGGGHGFDAACLCVPCGSLNPDWS